MVGDVNDMVPASSDIWKVWLGTTKKMVGIADCRLHRAVTLRYSYIGRCVQWQTHSHQARLRPQNGSWHNASRNLVRQQQLLHVLLYST